MQEDALMTEFEEPATTIARLLKNKMRVLLDSGDLAQVNVTGEWQTSDAFTGFDGQVTVGLAECVDQKIELTGKIRRRTFTLRVNAWTTDAPAQESGRDMRDKILQEVNRVIRENRKNPSETTYSFVGLASDSQTCKCFSGNNEATPGADWSELSETQYQKLWYSDDERCQISGAENGDFAVLLFGFKIDAKPAVLKQLTFTFEGYGTSPSGDGIAVKAWNDTAEAWQNTQSGSGNEDEAVTLALTANLSQNVDEDGYVWFLATTVHASDGQTPALLSCDYASLALAVNGVAYADVTGYRNLDRVDLKPFVYRTEFTVKSWFIENIGE
jgi:hypothetical protein